MKPQNMELSNNLSTPPRLVSRGSHLSFLSGPRTSGSTIRHQTPIQNDKLTDEEKQIWSDYIDDCMNNYASTNPQESSYCPQWFNNADLGDAPSITQEISWTAFPKLVKTKYPRDAKRWEIVDNDRRGTQDEYCEWWVEKNSQGKVIAVTFTCENPEYWSYVIARDQDRTVALYRELLGNKNIQKEDLFDQTGRYIEANKFNSNSQTGVVHLVQRNNTLGAEIDIAARATLVRTDAAGTPKTDPDALIRCSKYGSPGRFSDPHIGASVNQLARAGHAVSLTEPAALYIKGITFGQWSTPDGTHPKEFWKILRGDADHAVRCRFSVPPEYKYVVGDIKLNGKNIQYGGQLADLIQIKLTGLAKTELVGVKSVPFCLGDRPQFRISPELNISSLGASFLPATKEDQSHPHLFCCIPTSVPMEHVIDPNSVKNVPDDALSLLLQTSNKWNPGDTLTWAYLEEPPYAGDDEIIQAAFAEWASICNLKFKQLDQGNLKAMVRISFKRGGSWSLVGTDILLREYKGKATMNFGWPLSRQPITASHEIGHTMGFPHEHQNPNAGISWNKEAVYEEMTKQSPPWSRAETDHNILNKLSGVTGSDWDSASVMHYGFRAGLIRGPPPYNKDGIPFPESLSEKDKAMALSFYPFTTSAQPVVDAPVSDLKFGQTLSIQMNQDETKTFSLQLPQNSDFNVAVLIPGKDAFIKMFLLKGGRTQTSGSSVHPVHGHSSKEPWTVQLHCIQAVSGKAKATLVLY